MIIMIESKKRELTKSQDNFDIAAETVYSRFVCFIRLLHEKPPRDLEQVLKNGLVPCESRGGFHVVLLIF